MFGEFCSAARDASSLPTSYPAQPFTPPATGQWLQVVWTQNGGIDYALSDDDAGVRIGFFRVLVHGRKVSAAALQATADVLMTAIPKGTQLGDAYVSRAPEATGPVDSAADGSTFVTVTWRYLTR